MAETYTPEEFVERPEKEGFFKKMVRKASLSKEGKEKDKGRGGVKVGVGMGL